MKYDFELDMSVDTSATLILKRVKPGTRVLEFGPATGYMSRYLKDQLGCTVYCVEVDPKAAAIGKQHCHKMIVADVEAYTWQQEIWGLEFDYILFADVLEHLKDPQKALSEAKKFLAKAGTILISVPNIGHNAVLMDLLQGKFKYRPLGILDDTHLRFFNRQNLLELLEATGLSPVELIPLEVKPEDTEFRQKYTNFSKEVASCLLSREDGHVYQFVVATQIRTETMFADYTNLGLMPKIEDNTYLQIFLSNEGKENDFTEENSLKAQVDFRDHQFKEYCFEFCGEIPRSLRIDPVNRSGYVEIKELEMLGKKNGSLLKCDVGKGFLKLFALSGIVTIMAENLNKFLCIDNDPQLNLDLSKLRVKYQEDEFTLKIVMRYADSIPLDVVYQNNDFQHQVKTALQKTLGSKIMSLNKLLLDLEKKRNQ